MPGAVFSSRSGQKDEANAKNVTILLDCCIFTFGASHALVASALALPDRRLAFPRVGCQ
jgi:hypothetical protein